MWHSKFDLRLLSRCGNTDDDDNDDNNKKKKEEEQEQDNDDDDDDEDDNNNDNNNRAERRNSTFFTIFSLRREPSPTCTLRWPGRNHVPITCIERFSRATRRMPRGTKGQHSH